MKNTGKYSLNNKFTLGAPYENKSSNGKKFCFYLSLVFCFPSVYQIFGISILIFTLI